MKKRKPQITPCSEATQTKTFEIAPLDRCWNSPCICEIFPEADPTGTDETGSSCKVLGPTYTDETPFPSNTGE
jgi:hypothetical protein